MWWLDSLDFMFGIIWGVWFARNYAPSVPVTTKVTLPPNVTPEEPKYKYVEVYAPVISKLEVAATFGDGVRFNKKGSQALANIVKDLSVKLDRAVELALIVHSEKQAKVNVFAENAWAQKDVRPKKTT